MKILYLVSGIGPPAGWGTEFIQDLIFELSKKGINATIVNPIYKHTHPSWNTWAKGIEKKYKVRMVPLEAPAWIKERLLLHFALTPLFVTWAVIKLLRSQKFDLIHEFSSTPPILLRSLVFKVFFCTPTIFTLSVYNNTILGKLFWIKLFDFAQTYFLPSRDIVDAVKSLGIQDRKIVYCPPGTNLDQFHETISPANARKKLQLPTGKFIFSYFGSLTKEKGVLDLVEAARLIRKDMRQKILIVLFAIWKGSGQHKKIREKIQSLKLPHLKLIEKYINIPTLLAASDVIILPQQTGHGTTIPPISILETLAAGKSIIATNIIGVKELINNKNGILVPPNNSNSLRKAIEKIHRRGIQENNNALLIKQYDIKRSIKLHFEVYKKLYNMIER